jgi:hypothetical protein
VFFAMTAGLIGLPDETATRWLHRCHGSREIFMTTAARTLLQAQKAALIGRLCTTQTSCDMLTGSAALKFI